MVKLMKRTILSAITACVISVSSAMAAEAPKIPEYDFKHEGVLGKFDEAQLQRGFQVFKEVCSTCHSLSYVHFRNLEDLGYTEQEVKAFATEYQVQNKLPNADGEMFMRPGRASDKIPGPYQNEAEARAGNGGAYPPDLSLITKARANGSDYTRALFLGYVDPPAGKEIPAGQYYNKYFAGGQIAMPMPMSDGLVTYAQENIPQTVEQYATDVAAFLTWTAEPKLEARKRTGLWVMLYLFIMTILFYIAKKRIWKSVH